MFKVLREFMGGNQSQLVSSMVNEVIRTKEFKRTKTQIKR